MSNNYGQNVEGTTATNTSTDDNEWISPTTVDNDEGLQAALQGDEVSQPQDIRGLDLNSGAWGGMQSGAIDYDSTQESNWLGTVPEQYRAIASRWAEQQGMVRIIPVHQKQKFTYSTVAYIANKQEEPKTQTFPISDVSVTPHQITFDFYDTTEGRVGVSHAVEKHMTVEFDVYLTDLLASYWIFGDTNEYVFGGTTIPNLKKQFWDAVGTKEYLNFEYDLEQTPGFAEFRNTFLQQHSGWICKFISHTFGSFQGVITDVTYNIGSGESFAKWHIKLEEAIFTDAYQETGQKAQETSNGSTEGSGDAPTEEDVTVE